MYLNLNLTLYVYFQISSILLLFFLFLGTKLVPCQIYCSQQKEAAPRNNFRKKKKKKHQNRLKPKMPCHSHRETIRTLYKVIRLPRNLTGHIHLLYSMSCTSASVRKGQFKNQKHQANKNHIKEDHQNTNI